MEHAGTQQVSREQDWQVEKPVLKTGKDTELDSELGEVEEQVCLQQPKQRLLWGQVSATAESPLTLLLMIIIYIHLYDH